jgi:hypothetical protein
MGHDGVTFSMMGGTPSVHKYNYSICVGQSNLSLIKFIVKSISIYVFK